MSENSPLVSVYMPTKNRLGMLKRAIQSVLAQTYQNIELIVVDDGSTDGTREYLEQLAQDDTRVSFLFNAESKGACHSRNRAINQAKGTFVTGIDDDDEFVPHRIQTLVDAYDPKWAYVCAGIIWHYGAHQTTVGATDMVISKQDILSKDYAFNQVLVERDRIIAAGLFDEAFPACQDWDMWTRLGLTFGDGKRIGEALYVVHVGHDEPRISSSGKKMQAYRQYFEKHKPHMSAVNIKDHGFIQAKMNRSFPSPSLITRHNKREYLRYLVSYFLPALSMWRLKLLRGKK